MNDSTTRVNRRGRIAMTPSERIAAFMCKFEVDEATSCWQWTAGLGPKGYGAFNAPGVSTIAHRFAYKTFVGPIPEGLQLDHLCRNRRCVNPAHLEPVTGRENQRRGLINQNVQKTHCPCGLEYDYHYTGNNGNVWRRCTTCFSAYKREWRARNKAA